MFCSEKESHKYIDKYSVWQKRPKKRDKKNWKMFAQSLLLYYILVLELQKNYFKNIVDCTSTAQ
jgi:hypothetical protein